MKESDWKISYVFTLGTIILSILLLSLINRNTDILSSLPDIAYPVLIGLVSGFVCGYLSPFQYKRAAFAAALTIIALGAIPLLVFMKKPEQYQSNDLGGVFLILIMLIVVVLLFVLSVFLAIFLIIGAVIGANVKRQKLGSEMPARQERSAKPGK